ncbi:thiamine biosynthesis lipoprotein [Nakamurella sp. UYEF19]|uniref:FAD:protein FMN transferase n=1 Tax=Nakamurella sp. UYEF19 TaxID=1756392 RepID=UPI0033933F3E
MNGSLSTGSTRVDFQIWSTTATLVVTDPAALAVARHELDDELASIEKACSRFRPDSEINALLRTPGVEVELSPVLNDAMSAALRVAAATGYLVDPTVAAAVIALGYDRDIRALRDMLDQALEVAAVGTATAATRPAPGAWHLQHDAGRRLLTVPAGVGLDLGATAKALAADRAAARITRRTGSGVLVGLGGDIAVAGQAPAGGWTIAVADDHRHAEAAPQTRVAITAGGLATSSTTTRAWRTPAGARHHLVDPRTGENPVPWWRTVSVAAGSALDANAAATAAIICGERAPAWLAAQSLPSRLVDMGGQAVTVAGWPDDEKQAA